MRQHWRQMVCPFMLNIPLMARKFYYDTGEEKIGPVTGHTLLHLRAEGRIEDDTWVRCANSATWRHFAELDLRKEEQEEANPTLWQLLTRYASWRGILLFVAVMVVLLALFIGLVSVAGPLLLVVLVLWILSHFIKGGDS